MRLFERSSIYENYAIVSIHPSGLFVNIKEFDIQMSHHQGIIQLERIFTEYIRRDCSNARFVFKDKDSIYSVELLFDCVREGVRYRFKDIRLLISNGSIVMARYDLKEVVPPIEALTKVIQMVDRARVDAVGKYTKGQKFSLLKGRFHDIDLCLNDPKSGDDPCIVVNHRNNSDFDVIAIKASQKYVENMCKAIYNRDVFEHAQHHEWISSNIEWDFRKESPIIYYTDHIGLDHKIIIDHFDRDRVNEILRQFYVLDRFEED